MAFDGVVTRSIVYELNKNLKGAKENRVLEQNKNESTPCIQERGSVILSKQGRPSTCAPTQS